MIQRFTGILIDVEEAGFLADVLEHAARIGGPSPKVDHLIRRLRRAVGEAGLASGGANETANIKRPQPDPGHLRAYDLLAAADAARIIGCSTANVRYLRARGHLPAHRAGSRWLYPAAPVVEYAERRAKRLG